jgi:hypothetical protein
MCSYGYAGGKNERTKIFKSFGGFYLEVECNHLYCLLLDKVSQNLTPIQ